MKNRAELPTLYSLKNCPYAMRARMAIYVSNQPVKLRDIKLNDKPSEMLLASPKGTVPVLVVSETHVIDESLAIMSWVFDQSDPNNYLRPNKAIPLTEQLSFIQIFDVEFKNCLNNYRSAKRYHDSSLLEARQLCVDYLKDLELRLNAHQYLMADTPSLADLALVPFIRQFARVERQWYLQSPYPKLRQWLDDYLQSHMFSKVMAHHPLWLETNKEVIFGSDVNC